jgi:ParB/RepB/Spo0J family partition protein
MAKAIKLEPVKVIPWDDVLIVQDRASTPREDKELTESIRNLQLINPITLIQTADGKYKVAAGKRRAVSLQKIYPDGLRSEHFKLSVNDGQTLAYAENSIRKNFTLREEIEHLQRIMEENPDTPLKVIADKLGKTESTVRRRMAIATLPDEYLEWLDNPEIRLDRMEELAMLTDEEREDIVEYQCCQAERLKKYSFMLPDGGICDKCNGCQFNTATDALFDDEWICTNSDCYIKTMQEMAKVEIELLKKSGKNFIVQADRELGIREAMDLVCMEGRTLPDWNKGDNTVVVLKLNIGSMPVYEEWQVSDNLLHFYGYFAQMARKGGAKSDPRQELNGLRYKLDCLQKKEEDRHFKASVSFFREKANIANPPEFRAYLEGKAAGNLNGRLAQIMFDYFINSNVWFRPIKDLEGTRLELLTADDIVKIFERSTEKAHSMEQYNKVLNQFGVEDFPEVCAKVKKLLPPPDEEIGKLQEQIDELQKVIDAENNED